METGGMRYILAIDTSMTGCGVCVYDMQSGASKAAHHNQAFGQAEHLIPLIQSCVSDFGVALADIDLIAASVGPGSFTGLRTGLTAAKTLALALGCPVYDMNSFLALFRTALKNNDLIEFKQVASIIDTRRSDYFIRVHDMGSHVEAEPCIMTAEQVVQYNAEHNGVFWVGDYGDLDLNGLNVSKPDPVVIAEYAAEHYDSSQIYTLEPLYLRDADIGVSKKKLRKLAV